MIPDEKLEMIQEEIKVLSAKELQMVEARQKQLKSYEEVKTLYQRLFGQKPLPPDFKLEAIRTEIARLEKREENCLKILQVN
jgi:hypothetical protein